MPPRLLLLETSQQPGVVALSVGDRLVGEVRLDEARRHARDLVPAAKRLLEQAGLRARQLDGVVVGLGPGSYTGLRVGVMSAKTLAFAVKCPLVGVETFAAIAHQAPRQADRLAVLADAQQGKVYIQEFSRSGDRWIPTSELGIRLFDDWAKDLRGELWLTGPGLERLGDLAGQPLAPRLDWTPRADSLLALGLASFHAGRRDDPFALEPLYLRPSSAEENWRKRGKS